MTIKLRNPAINNLLKMLVATSLYFTVIIAAIRITGYGEICTMPFVVSIDNKIKDNPPIAPHISPTTAGPFKIVFI